MGPAAAGLGGVSSGKFGLLGSSPAPPNNQRRVPRLVTPKAGKPCAEDRPGCASDQTPPTTNTAKSNTCAMSPQGPLNTRVVRLAAEQPVAPGE
ncbi:MAG: hypothetical protein CMJ25_32500 [Phycisphaerae bacterium]|nr:hypothetical protein [Phycisphaerae bacterium]